MTLIEISDKAVDAIRGRAQEVADGSRYYEEDVEKRAAAVLAALDGRNGDGQVDLDDAALAWLEEDHKEMRHCVEDRLGLVDGLAVDWEGSTGDAHYVWAVEDIAARLELAAKIEAGEPVGFERLEPEPVNGYEGMQNPEDIAEEFLRIERWWRLIEGTIPGEATEAEKANMRDEFEDYLETRGAFARKVLELIAEGKVDPIEAAKAAITDAQKVAA